MSCVSRGPEWICRCFPVCPLQDHLIINTFLSTWWALSPKRLEWMYRGFPVSLMNTLHKTNVQTYGIGSTALSPGKAEQWTCRGFPSVTDMKLCLLGDLNKCAEAYLCNKCPSQDHLLSKPIILTQWALSPERFEQTGRSFLVCHLPDHLLSNTIISTW